MTMSEELPFEAWFVVEVDIDTDREEPMHVRLRGPFESETRSGREKEQKEEAWEQAVDEWDGDIPYDFKDWSVKRVLLRDYELEKLDREDEERFEIRRKAAGAVGASMLASDGIGPLAGKD